MKRKGMTCICCPNGCELQVEWLHKASPCVLSVEGNACSKGYDYAVEEIVRPARTVTGTVCVHGGVRPLVSVRTAEPVPKASIEEILEILRPLTVAAQGCCRDGGTGGGNTQCIRKRSQGSLPVKIRRRASCRHSQRCPANVVLHLDSALCHLWVPTRGCTARGSASA